MELNPGHTAWMLTASALVLLMTPGLAFFYGGLVRARNVISTLMYSFMAMAVVSIVWVLWGYSLAFGEGSAFIGDLSFFGLSGIDVNQMEDNGIPTLLFVIFQMMFAIITPAIITGAFVERFKFTTYLVFLVVWVTIVYAPVAHWVWGGRLDRRRWGRRARLRGRYRRPHKRRCSGGSGCPARRQEARSRR